MTSATRWSDLNQRVGSAIGLVVICGAAIWVGGAWFLLMAAVFAGAMVWELARMTAPEAASSQALVIAIGAAVCLAIAGSLKHSLWEIALSAPALALALTDRRDRTLASLYALGVMVAVWGVVGMRAGSGGMAVLLWLVVTIAVADILGYFAGRRFGGPKFWPSISPKKTWSGTVAGWIGAMLVGTLFWMGGHGGMELIPLSALVAFAGQMGDIMESWIKRREGVKDSSSLIPGHGGVLDRFDALAAGALLIVLLSALDILSVDVWG